MPTLRKRTHYRWRGLAIMQARDSRGLTQRDLAKLVNMDQQQISRFENGHRATHVLLALADIAHAVGMRPGELFERCVVPVKPTTEQG